MKELSEQQDFAITSTNLINQRNPYREIYSHKLHHMGQFLVSILTTPVSTATRLWAGQSGFNSWQGLKFFSSPLCPD